tara:strand:- start:175 stop:1938 length:1764 start_codon:yes stop_codon:yes gene_type:complete
MKKVFKNILTTTISMILASIVLIILIISFFAISVSSVKSEKKATIKPNSILTINLAENIVVERKSSNPFESISSIEKKTQTIELKEILDNIEKAKYDDRIKAIYINTSFTNSGISQTEEIRNKLLEFKKTGKKIISYSETYSQNAYYLSSVANKLYIHPEGGLDLRGLSASIMFYKGLLKKLDIDMQIIRHGKFKSAIEPFILEKMSVENREQIQLLLNGFYENIMDSIASQRGLNLEEIEGHIDELKINSAKSCYDLSYVDGLLYQDQIEDSLISISETEKLNLININKYSKVKIKNKEISRNKIAIIYATGAINSGKGDEKSIGSETTREAIKNARTDKNVKAIVLRINSGGGSALASDVILREALLAKKQKPFVVSMGDYAASGGYYIACMADSIVANPTTLTGSIGVFGMIPNLQNFYKNKLGITIDTVNTNKYSDIGINRRLSNFERNKIQMQIENVYDTFISHVSNGRNIPKDEVDKIGQGRVWNGYDAKRIGLIDVYGGLEKAIEISAKLAEIKNYRTVSLPKKKDPIEIIINNLSKEVNINNIIFNKIGITSSTIDPIENLLQDDIIQARMPFIIKLKQ